MNATDAGSGRRVLIAPFEISTGAAAAGRTGSLLHFPFGQPIHPPSSPIEKTPALGRHQRAISLGDARGDYPRTRHPSLEAPENAAGGRRLSR